MSSALMAQDTDKYAEKVASIDSIMYNLYAVISGEKGEARNWELFDYLFTPDAKLIPVGKDKEGKIGYQVMTPAGYKERAGKWLEENGFHEIEIWRKVETFGSVTHVFSTYESYYSKNDEKPFTRGINSIQLLHDGNRYWVMTIYWNGESEENPIPQKYLPE